MFRPDVDELRCYHWLFFGRGAADGDPSEPWADRRSLLLALIDSPAYETSVLEPIRRGAAVEGGLFDDPPPFGLRRWAAERLPLSDVAAADVVAASNWAALHRAILSDRVFLDELAAAEHAAPNRMAAPKRAAVADRADIANCYRLFLGREQEETYGDGDDSRIGQSIDDVARGFLDSLEFERSIFDLAMSGRQAIGALFESPPRDELREWAAERLPLTEKGRSATRAARDWRDLRRAIFADARFVDEVVGHDSRAALIGSLPRPWAPTRAESADIDFCYRLFLGRCQESGYGADTRIGLDLVEVARNFILSIEFERVVRDRMKAGRTVTGQIFDHAPTAELREWAAHRLPLIPWSIPAIRAATTWHALHKAIFADPAFREIMLGGEFEAAQIVDAPPPWTPLFAERADIEFSYRFFLGREWEAPSDEDGRIGFDLGELARCFILSGEFTLAVAEPMKAGAPIGANLFAIRPTAEIIRWAADRLPLSEAGRKNANAAVCWHSLHCAVFGDRLFVDVTGPDLPSASLGALPLPLSQQAELIEESWLFERDWYLETYRDVARSGGDPLQHYLLHGVAEGRNPNRLFDTRWYLTAYPDVWTQKINPLAHYVLEGARRGYEPHPFFSTPKFHELNPAVAGGERTPLAKYLHPREALESGFLPEFGPYDIHAATQSIERQCERPEIERHIRLMTLRPRFLVLIGEGSAEAVAATRESLARQIFPDVETLAGPDAIASVEPFLGAANYLVWLDAGDQLHWDALYEFASSLNADPTLKAIYCDHATRSRDGGVAPIHKPDWSPDYLESHDYIGSAACFEWSKARAHFAHSESRFDFLLRFTEAPTSIAHIGRVLMTRESDDDPRAARERAAFDLRALNGRLTRTGRRGAVAPHAAGAPSYDVKIALKARPLVSIVIPTAARVIDYQGKKIDLIVACLESITAKSTYRNLEFVIVDNGDFDRDRLSHIAEFPITYVTYDLPEVNIAKKINLGASLARGDVLLPMNDDIEVVANDWIERMLGHLEKPHVGVVGAKLVYPNRTIQHAGVVFCDGAPDHVRRGWPRDDVGYVYSTGGVRNFVAVTGAVSMARAEDFRRVGGYSEELPIDYNDIDFCFKLRKLGYFVVYEPRAELIHYESVSAVKPPRPQDAVFFYGRWASQLEDPYYNQYCLSNHPPTFEPSYGERRS